VVHSWRLTAQTYVLTHLNPWKRPYRIHQREGASMFVGTDCLSFEAGVPRGLSDVGVPPLSQVVSAKGTSRFRVVAFHHRSPDAVAARSRLFDFLWSNGYSIRKQIRVDRFRRRNSNADAVGTISGIPVSIKKDDVEGRRS
jgi:hypothetical protein